MDSDALFSHQQELGPLPLPALSETLERYLSSVRPLLTDDEFAHTTAVCADFQKEGGDGEALQTFLEEKAENERNWMEEWWEQLAYLRTRTSMAIYINWFGVMPEWGFPMDKLSAAALLIDGLLKMRVKIKTGQYPVEKMRGAPLDMHQFTRVFGMTRIPQEGADELVCAHDSTHIALMRDGGIATVEVCDASGAPLPLQQLRSALGAALQLADEGAVLESTAVEGGAPQKDGGLIGAKVNASLLTALNRDRWAAERAKLLEDPVSAASLKAVESAIVCVNFDRASPESKQEVARRCHGGDCRNLWFDKSVTAMVFENGRVGINAEHTPVDAMTIVALMLNGLEGMKALLSDPVQRKALVEAPLMPLHGGSSKPPKLLQWHLGESARVAIEAASAEVVALASDCEVVHLPFLHYGKGLIKRIKLHPDFYTQMAIQLAVYRMHKQVMATYETGHTRAFYHGRTDTVRTLSVESKAWVEAADDPSVAVGEKVALLRQACSAHSEQVQRVLTGSGIDRHILGLYIAAHLKGQGIPSLFTDKAFKLSGGGGNYRMSTSNVGYTPMFGGFAPMTKDGYGVCYAQVEGRMNIMVTAWRSCAETSAQGFADTLSKTLIDMSDLLAAAEAEEPSSKL